MKILNPVRLVMRPNACQVCYTTENITEINPFMDLGSTDFHYGYQYCEKCKEAVYVSIKKLNELCKKNIEENLNVKYESFDIEDLNDILKNKNLTVQRTDGTIQDNWKFSGYIYNDEFYIIVVDNTYKIRKNISLIDFLKYNSSFFL
jgi:hypothetical protein